MDQSPIVFAGTTLTPQFKDISKLRPVVLEQIPEYLKYYCRYMGKDNYLVRLHNMREDISVPYAFPSQTVQKEYTMTANQLKDYWQKTRMTWNEESQH